jgi:Ribbon-helix-helix protein, copG family.
LGGKAVTLWLDEDDLKRLDERAEEAGLSRSAFIGLILRQHARFSGDLGDLLKNVMQGVKAARKESKKEVTSKSE